MKIDTLEKFAVFAQYMNYSRAAQEIGISQPALSYQIAQMEKELKFSLVEHGPHPRLTTAGMQFAEAADKLAKSYDQIVAQCRAAARQQADALIFERPICSAEMHHEFNQLILRFNSATIDTAVEFSKTPQDTLENSLALGKVDAGFVYSRPEFIEEDFGDGLFGFARLPLPDSTDVGFFMRSNQRLAKKPYIELADLEGRTIVLPADARYRIFEHSLRQCIQDAGARINILHRGKDLRDAMRGLAIDELMFAGYDQADEQGFETELGVVMVPYRGDEWNTSPYVIYRIDNRNPALERFLRYIEKVAS